MASLRVLAETLIVGETVTVEPDRPAACAEAAPLLDCRKVPRSFVAALMRRYLRSGFCLHSLEQSFWLFRDLQFAPLVPGLGIVCRVRACRLPEFPWE